MKPHEITKLRQRLGWTKAQLARALRVSPSGVTRYENGERSPDLHVIDKFPELIRMADYRETPRQIHPTIFKDRRGTLRIWPDLPFPVVRAFEIRDVPKNETRGHHAHPTTDQVITCMHGKFWLSVKNRKRKLEKFLMEPGVSIFVPHMHWIVLSGFSEKAICLVLCSQQYVPPITNFDEFLKS